MEKLIYGGKYSHYKSPTKRYQVVWEGTNKETWEEVVIYKTLYKIDWYSEDHLWVRPRGIFLWYKEYNWERVKIFTHVEK